MYQHVLAEIDNGCLEEAMRLLPLHMNTPRARAQLLKTTLQEARGVHRRQLGNGPARGLWQFELGALYGKSRTGKEWGLMVHPATAGIAKSVCTARGCPFDARYIHTRLEHDDVLAAALARLNYWWRPEPLPRINDRDGSWRYYVTTWNPGKPHPETWPEFHEAVLLHMTVPD